MIYHWVYDKSNMTGTTGTAYLSSVPEFIPGY